MIDKNKIKNKKGLKIISNIQRVRTNNNTSWMDLLRIAVKHAPKESKKVLKRINKNDKKITYLIKRLSKIK